MRKLNSRSKKGCVSAKNQSEQGAALVITILVMLLLIGFVTLVISRVSTETIITSVDSSENQALAATEANLESTSRDFADIFERKLVPTAADIASIKTGTITGFDNYKFTKLINQTDAAQPTLITGGTYSGLYSLRDVWEIDITATDKATNVETQLRRRLLNDRIPLFQFGIFYEGDLELNRPPLFTFGGRVHTNSNLFISAAPAANGDGIYFRSKATVVGEIVNDIWKTGTHLSGGYDDQGSVFVADGGGNFQELKTGQASVTCINPVGPNVFASKPNLPACSKRNSWDTDKNIFQSNLDTHTQRLDLPLKKSGVAFNELIKRGKNVNDLTSNGAGGTTAVTAATQDNVIISRERFANKQGMRISLSDAQNKLPGCATKNGASDDCGVRLDRTAKYTPIPMVDALVYKTTPLNAVRFAQTGKEVWIKVELVDYDFNNNVPLPKDITKDILSLGVTEPAPIASDFQIFGYDNQTDQRSIIKLQRITMPGLDIPNSGGTTYISHRSIGGQENNLVVRYTGETNLPPNIIKGCNTGTGTVKDSFAAPYPSSYYSSADETNNLLCAKFNNDVTKPYDVSIAPFPIEIFDGREGMPTDDTDYTNNFNSDEVPRAGVMSMIDIDVANLKKFLNGNFDGKFPIAGTTFSDANLRALKSTDIPENRGWVLYISDRRGDADFDGEYDMEDVFPDGVLQFNEDINSLTSDIIGNGVLERALGTEAPSGASTLDSYRSAIPKGQAASADHGYYRRGIRLINGKELPGSYNTANPNATKGFTVASENGIYVRGNYNATNVTLSGDESPALPENYFPQGDADVPASIVGDAVMILSNSWDDSKSFREPFNVSSRKASHTIVRFAMLSGQGVTGKSGGGAYTPSQFGQLNGGVHNFKRYLESWKGVRLNYSGSLVNLFTSRNNNGFFKCCVVYEPPYRDWTFDKTFLDANRLPPGTPYIYTMAFTGFQRVSD